MPPRLSPVEEEVVFLKAITDLIDSMVNFEILRVAGVSPDSNIVFHTATHQRFFNILLVDLLSTSDKSIVGRQVPYLQALGEICEHPHFDRGGSVDALHSATRAFRAWLEVKPIVPVRLRSVDEELEVGVPRSTFLAICGNISKHGMLRLSKPARQVQEILEQRGRAVSLGEAVLALEDFYERFHTDILNYLASSIAEQLNEIRWGIHEYLLPEYRRSYTPQGGDPPRYAYTYPPAVTSELPRALYWDLMNDIRRRPYLKRFRVTKYLKMRY